jgi:hypothetical protein
MGKEELVGWVEDSNNVEPFFFLVVVVVLLCLHFILFMANGPICKINNMVVVEQSFSNNVKQISRTLGIDIVVVEAHPFA